MREDSCSVMPRLFEPTQLFGHRMIGAETACSSRVGTHTGHVSNSQPRTCTAELARCAVTLLQGLEECNQRSLVLDTEFESEFLSRHSPVSHLATFEAGGDVIVTLALRIEPLL